MRSQWHASNNDMAEDCTSDYSFHFISLGGMKQCRGQWDWSVWKLNVRVTGKSQHSLIYSRILESYIKSVLLLLNSWISMGKISSYSHRNLENFSRKLIWGILVSQKQN